MDLKTTVDEILKEKNRTFSWLVEKMGKTFDGLKLSLLKESLKYKDIKKMAEILEISPAALFEADTNTYKSEGRAGTLAESKSDYQDLKNNLKNCKEMVSALKDQIKDKDTIILLMKKD